MRSVRRRTASPARRPGSRSEGVQTTRAVSPARSTGYAIRPRWTPNSRVCTTTGMRTTPARGGAALPTWIRFTVAARRAWASLSRKPASVSCSRVRADVSPHASRRSPRAQAAAKRCATAADGSSARSRVRTKA